MIEYYLLEQLIAFSEEKSLSKAANKLHISQPALSRSMRKIEDIMGVPLFKRTKNKIKLNDAGKVAVEYAKKALKSNQAVIINTRAVAQKPLNIRLGICNEFIQDRTNALFASCYPYTNITYDRRDDAQLLINLKNDNDDLIVVHTKPPTDDPDLYYQHYFDEQLMLTISRNDLLAKKEELRFKDLDGMLILAVQGADFWLDLFKENIPNLKLLVQNNMTILDKIVMESGLPVFNTSIEVKNHPGPISKVTIPIVDPSATISHYLVCRREAKI